jgi:hypothetical protein
MASPTLAIHPARSSGRRRHRQWQRRHWVVLEKEDSASLAKLHLIDFGSSGDSDNGGTWSIKATIDLFGAASAWHRLGMDYDPATGAVIASYDGTIYNFNTITGMLGTFYAGYRESLASVPVAKVRPATFDVVPEPTGVALGALAAWDLRRTAAALSLGCDALDRSWRLPNHERWTRNGAWADGVCVRPGPIFTRRRCEFAPGRTWRVAVQQLRMRNKNLRKMRIAAGCRKGTMSAWRKACLAALRRAAGSRFPRPQSEQ